MLRPLMSGSPRIILLTSGRVLGVAASAGLCFLFVQLVREEPASIPVAVPFFLACGFETACLIAGGLLSRVRRHLLVQLPLAIWSLATAAAISLLTFDYIRHHGLERLVSPPAVSGVVTSDGQFYAAFEPLPLSMAVLFAAIALGQVAAALVFLASSRLPKSQF